MTEVMTQYHSVMTVVSHDSGVTLHLVPGHCPLLLALRSRDSTCHTQRLERSTAQPAPLRKSLGLVAARRALVAAE